MSVKIHSSTNEFVREKTHKTEKSPNIFIKFNEETFQEKKFRN